MQKRRRSYSTDLTDRQLAAIAELVTDILDGSLPRRANSRELVNVILYALRACHVWRLLPRDFLPRQTLYCYLRRRQVKRV
jgi:transposase